MSYNIKLIYWQRVARPVGMSDHKTMRNALKCKAILRDSLQILSPTERDDGDNNNNNSNSDR